MAARDVEHERKFLLHKVPRGLAACPRQEIEQGYLAVGPRGEEEVRVRRTKAGAVLTVKRGRGEVRREVEVPLSAAAARKLWPLTKGRRLSKTRYRVTCDGGKVEVDVYRGRLRGLVVVEVERDSAREVRGFEPPRWFGREITGERAYSNCEMARTGRKPRRT